MKIASVGLVYNQLETVIAAVEEVCKPTHGSNNAITSASVVAYLVSQFSRKIKNLEDIDDLVNEAIDACEGIGFDMPCASLKERIKLADEILKLNLNEEDFKQKIYHVIGTNVNCIETLPAVISIVKYTKGDVRKCASICASIGGDTDTVAAIACSICGSLGSLPERKEIDELERVNQIKISEYADKIMKIIK